MATDKLVELRGAVISGAADDVQRLLEAGGVDVKYKADFNTTFVYLAAREGHADVAKLLIGAGAPVDIACTRGSKFTPLMVAAAKGHCKVVSVLLYAGGASVHAVDPLGNTALHIAVAESNGHKRAASSSIVCDLMAKGGSLTAENMYGEIPLHIAVKQCKTSDVADILLLRDGIDSKSRAAQLACTDRFGQHPLRIAIVNGNVKNAEFLLQYCGGVEDVDGDGKTALHHAASLGDVDLLNTLLLNYCADTQVRDRDGRKPLYYARSDVIRELLDEESDNEAEDEADDEADDKAGDKAGDKADDKADDKAGDKADKQQKRARFV